MKSAVVPEIHVGDELSVWTKGSIYLYRVQYKIMLPPGPASTVDFGSLAVGTNPATPQVNKTTPAAIQLDDGYLIRLRFRPLDDIRIRVYQLGGDALNYIRNTHFDISLLTGRDDPEWETTELFSIGKDKDPQFEILNPRPTTQARSRVVFWGERYLVEPIGEATKPTIFVPAQANN